MSVFPDDEWRGGFYALPDSPRLAVDPPEPPQMQLLLYGNQQGSQFLVTGALFTCTTAIGLSATEKSQLTESLQARLTREAGHEGLPDVGVSWLQLTWVQGRCELRLTDQIRLSGQPSLFGDNLCVYHQSFTAHAAADLEQAWADGLPDLFARYEITGQPGRAEFAIEGRPETNSYDINQLVSRVTLP